MVFCDCFRKKYFLDGKIEMVRQCDVLFSIQLNVKNGGGVDAGSSFTIDYGKERKDLHIQYLPRKLWTKGGVVLSSSNNI